VVTRAEGVQCARPQCSRLVPHRQTGRPARYCSALCRQAAYRERVRQAEQERRRAQGLAEAQATAARIWPEFEAAILDQSDGLAALQSYAAAGGRDGRDAAEWKLAELLSGLDLLRRLMRAYCQSSADVADLSEPGPAA
jgi:hypothetical protein